MPKAKKISIALVITLIIGMGLYFLFTLVILAPKESLSEQMWGYYEFQGMEYEIIGVIPDEEKNQVVYDVITGELSEEEAGMLAEKIIEDTIANTRGIKEITLFFYSDIISAGVEEVDVARADWTPDELTIQYKPGK